MFAFGCHGSEIILLLRVQKGQVLKDILRQRGTCAKLVQCLVDWALDTVLRDGLAGILRVRHALLAATI